MLNTIIIGGGPAGLSLLLALRQSDLLGSLISDGLKVIERGDRIGVGSLGNYAIRSDSHADSFFKSALINKQPDLSSVFSGEVGKKMISSRGIPIPLKLASEFTSAIGDEFLRWDRRQNNRIFETNATVDSIVRLPDGGWQVLCTYKDRKQKIFNAKNIILATGAIEHKPLSFGTRERQVDLAQYQQKTLLSSEFLGAKFSARGLPNIREGSKPKIAILGGSHSALSCVLKTLEYYGSRIAVDNPINMFHRNKLRITYQSKVAAWADGFFDFDSNDICERTGRVFPLAGFRCDSRDLVKSVWNNDPAIDGRVQFKRIEAENSICELQEKLRSADLIITATGYRPRAVKIYNNQENELSLNCNQVLKRPMVNLDSQVLGTDGCPVPGVFAIGLSTGLSLSGRYGEPSFIGEANGLALWQSDVGKSIGLSILRGNSPSNQACPLEELPL